MPLHVSGEAEDGTLLRGHLVVETPELGVGFWGSTIKICLSVQPGSQQQHQQQKQGNNVKPYEGTI